MIFYGQLRGFSQPITCGRNAFDMADKPPIKTNLPPPPSIRRDNPLLEGFLERKYARYEYSELCPGVPAEYRDGYSGNLLCFERRQKVQQKPGEDPLALHERLRPVVTGATSVIERPTRIITYSDLTKDVSSIVHVEGAVAILTSSCKHETPYQTLVGKRVRQQTIPRGDKPPIYIYDLESLGRPLTQEEKNKIYDR